MAVTQMNTHKIAPLFLLYQKLLQLLGDKRYYAEVQSIDVWVNSEIELNRASSNWLGAQAIFRLVATLARLYFKNILWVEQWFLLVDTNNLSSHPFDHYLPIMPPKDRFWADPHIIHKDGVDYIFVEEYFFKKKKAAISFIKFDKDGNHNSASPIIEKDYHLSYPFIFECEGTYFIVPESSENKTIEIYKCSQFPSQWQFVMNLMEGVSAVDTTLFFYSNYWWLFTGIPDKSEALPKVRLNLYYSKNLLSDQWTSHPQNPIVSDFTRARPAGNIFTIDGKIYRPSQDSSKAYGSGIHINEITTLSENSYAEECVQTIHPKGDRNIMGAHTYSRSCLLTAMDAYRRVPRLLIRN